jgi:nickel transport protein
MNKITRPGELQTLKVTTGPISGSRKVYAEVDGLNVPLREGAFHFPATVRVDHRLIADAGAGHVAEFTVTAEELPDTLPGKTLEPLFKEALVVNAVTTAQAPPLPMTKTAAVSLQRMIERSVARQIRPLREQLDAYEAKVRWHDVLGGIGYILGIAGVACYWLGRRPLHSLNTSDCDNGSTTESRK